MAEHGSGTAGARDGTVEAALLQERQQMFAGFTAFTTYAVAGVAAVLILLAIFLL